MQKCLVGIFRAMGIHGVGVFRTGDIELLLDYDAGLLDSIAVKNVTAHLRGLLGADLARPGRTLRDLELETAPAAEDVQPSQAALPTAEAPQVMWTGGVDLQDAAEIIGQLNELRKPYWVTPRALWIRISLPQEAIRWRGFSHSRVQPAVRIGIAVDHSVRASDPTETRRRHPGGTAFECRTGALAFDQT